MGVPCERARHKIQTAESNKGNVYPDPTINKNLFKNQKSTNQSLYKNEIQSENTLTSRSSSPTNTEKAHRCSEERRKINSNSLDKLKSILNYIRENVLSLEYSNLALRKLIQFRRSHHKSSKSSESSFNSNQDNEETIRKLSNSPSTFEAPHQSSLTALFYSSSTTSSSSCHYHIKHSLCFYAASSVLLALCYFISPTVASSTKTTSDAVHPM
jgi:hypothetical protein